MRIAICDDNINDLAVIQRYVTDYNSHFEIDTFPSGEKLLASIGVGAKYDLIFLDIHMQSNLSGYEAAKEIKKSSDSERPLIVFITITDQYVYKGYEVAWRYFCKPVSKEMIDAILFRAELEFQTKTCSIETASGIEVLHVNDIVYIETEVGWSLIHTTTSTLKSRWSLSNLMSILPNKLFFQTHRCYIVNMRYVVKYLKDQIFVRASGEEKSIFLSRHRRNSFIRAFSLFLGGE